MKALYKVLVVFSLSFLYINDAFAQSPDWAWARAIGDTSIDYGKAIGVDALGNVYTAGTFEGTVDFNSGSGTFNLTSLGSYDIFISKLDPSGNFIWAKAIGSPNSDFNVSLALDDSGNVYTTGSISGTTDFDPGPGTFYLTPASVDIFILKVDSTGNFIWASVIGGTTSDVAYSIAISFDGSVYTTGYYGGPADFDPGTGIFNLTDHGTFILKLDHSYNFVWAKAIKATNGTNGAVGYSIASDSFGNVYATGYLKGSADFDPDSLGSFNLTSAGNDDIFISKLDSMGNFKWASAIGAQSWDRGQSIAVDGSQNVITVGSYGGTVDFDPGTGIFNLYSTVNGGVFISKLDSSGNFVWARAIGGSQCYGWAASLDSFDNIYTTGYFRGTADFDPGLGIFNMTSVGPHDIFISKLDSAGNFVWVKAIGGASAEEGYAIAVNDSGNVYVTGYFQSSYLLFDSDTLTHADTSGNNIDLFVAKLSCITFTTINPIVCNSYTSPSGKYIWSVSGTYLDTLPNGSGCYNLITINLTIGTIYTVSTLYITSCDSYTSPSGKYTWTSSGTYMDTIPNSSGCDSLISLNLTIKSSTSGSKIVVACLHYFSPSGNYTWTSSGIYTDTIPNSVGCDSVIVINLFIKTVNSTVTQSGIILTASATGATYQWLDCDNGFISLSGETNQVFTASLNGNYAVIITQNGCTDTSACYSITTVSAIEMNPENNIEVFPNPALSYFVITLEKNFKKANVIITDISGKIIFTNTATETQKIELNTKDFAAGIYLVQIQTLDFIETRRVVVMK